MLQQQSAQCFLRKGDWVEITFDDYSLYSEGFKTSEVEMRTNEHPLNCLFIIQTSQTPTHSSKKYVHFDEPLLLRHKLSHKYLSYNQHFASKSELKLRNTISDNCEFLFRPLYKCQTLKSQNVRNGEECSLSLASMLYSSEKVGLVVGKYEKGSRERVSISLKKNQNSPLRLIRRSLHPKSPSGLLSLQIYRLKHNQTKNLLAYSKIWGQKSVELSNQKNNYCSYILLEKESADPREETAILKEHRVYIRFYGNRQYLAFSDNSIIYLAQQPNEESLFIFQQYASQAELTANTPLKLKHAKSQKYLSIKQNSLCITNFTPYNTWQFNCVPEDELVDVIFLNDTYAGLMNTLNDDSLTHKHKRKIRSILKQAVNFCYQTKKTTKEFLNLQNIKPSLKHEEQLLFSKIGYLPLLFKICNKMVDCQREQSKQEGRTDQTQKNDSFNDNEYIFIQLALMVCAICKDNRPNLILFCEQIKTFFEFIGLIRGTFELLFQLFGYNAMAVQIFENLQFTVKKTEMKGFSVLLQYLYGKQFPIKERIKIIKLLTSLVQDQHKNSILSHEQLLLETVNHTKMQKILYPLAKNNDHTLVVHLSPKNKQQLKVIIDSELYPNELTLLYEQLRLYICLCKRGSKKHFQLFRSIVSEDMLKHYLMQQIDTKYLAVFMEMLINIYLTTHNNTKTQSHIALTHNPHPGPFPSPSSHSSSLRVGLLQHQVQLQLQEMSPDKMNLLMDVNSLKQIKRLVLSLLHKKIEAGVLDEDLIIYMLALQKFLEIDICSSQEQHELLDRLTNALNTALAIPNQLNEPLVLQYLQMATLDLDIHLSQTAVALLQTLRNNHHPQLSRIEYSQQIITTTNEHIQTCLTQLTNSHTLTALEAIIQHCISEHKIHLFLKASQLYSKMANIGQSFANTIQHCIPIDSQDSVELFQTVTKLSARLNHAVSESLYGGEQVERQTGRKKLQQIVRQSCSLLEGDDSEEDKLNILSQKLMSELGFAHLVIQFVCQRRDQLRKPQSSQLFDLLFRFLTLLFLHCDANFSSSLPQLTKLAPLFRHIDRGQIRMLYSLTQLPTASHAHPLLANAYLAAAKSSFTPRVQVPLGLLKLVGAREELRTELSQQLIDDAQLLPALLKLQRKGQYLSLQVVRLCQFREEWVLYLLCCLRLLRTLLQTPGALLPPFAAVLREHLPLRLLLNLLEQAFRLEITSGDNALLYVFILKQTRAELIRLFSLLYLTHLDEDQHQLALQYMHKISSYLTHKYVLPPSNEQLLKALIYAPHAPPHPENDLKQLLTHYLRLDMQKQIEITAENINPLNAHLHLFLNMYYPFLFTLYERLKDEATEVKLHESIFNIIGSAFGQKNTKIDAKIAFNVQLESFLDTLWQQYQDLLSQKLTYAEFAVDSLAYFSSVKTAEELTKRSAGLKYKVQQQQEERLLLEGQQFFQHQQLKFILDSFLTNRNKVEKYLYEAILIILHNRQVHAHLALEQHTLNLRTKDIVEIIMDKLKDTKATPDTFVNFCQLLPLYLHTHQDSNPKQKERKEREWQPHLQAPQILSRLASSRQDPSNALLAVWVQGQAALLQDHLAGRFSSSRRRRPVVLPDSQQGLVWLGGVQERLRQVLSQDRLRYDNKLLLVQAHTYFQHRRLNHALNQHALSPEMLLRWLLLKLRYHTANVDRYFPLLQQVALTLKAYARFLLDFDKKYLPAQLQAKLRLGMRVLLQAMAGGNMRVLLMLLQHEVWEQINVVLLLDDSLPRALEEIDLSPYDFIKTLTRHKLPPLPASYLQGVLQLYNNSAAIYGEHNEVLTGNYPLVPVKSHFRDLKTHAIALVDEFSHTPAIAPQFFSKLDLKALDLNVNNTYTKYNYLFNNYTIAAVYTHAEYLNTPYQTLAQNLGFQNAVRMAGLRMRADQLNGRNQLSDRYLKIRVGLTKKSIQSYMLIFRDFVVDLVLLLVGACLRLVRRSRPPPAPKPDEVFDFFLARLGRVEVEWEGRLYLCDFMLYPECRLTQRARQKCLKQLNFASNQLKRESIASAMSKCCLHFENELQFSLSFWRAGLVIFLAQYIRVFRHIGNAIIVLENLLLVTNQLQTLNFNGFSIGYPFQIFSILNLFVSVPVLVVTLIKNVPLVVQVQRYQLRQGVGFLSRGYNSFSPAQQRAVLILKTVFTWDLAYEVIYTGVVCLVLLNKLFAAVLLLDVLLRIRSLRSLLLSILRPVYQIVLSVIALIILQYFFSILLYFFFSQNVNGYCDTLGDCFTFVLFASFRAVNGFVGYLFQQNALNANATSISIFAVFEDIYAIVIHTVMIAVLLAVVINSFVVTKADNAKQKEALSHACIICNIDRSRFNLQNRTSFQNHKCLTHYLFNYFHYRHRLNKARKEMMTDLELAVLESKNNDWIPDNRTSELENEGKL